MLTKVTCYTVHVCYIMAYRIVLQKLMLLTACLDTVCCSIDHIDYVNVYVVYMIYGCSNFSLQKLCVHSVQMWALLTNLLTMQVTKGSLWIYTSPRASGMTGTHI